MSDHSREAAASRQVPRVSGRDAGARRRFAELDRVSLHAAVRSDEGHIVPAGSTGTVVAVWNEGEAYDVEFTQPVAALATVEPDAIGALRTARPSR